MPIRAILFDLDGTLLDQFEAIHRAFVRVLTQMGFPEPSFEKVKRSVGGASEATMTKLIGAERAEEAVQILRPIFEEEMFNGLKALPGSREILEACKKHGLKTFDNLKHSQVQRVPLRHTVAPARGRNGMVGGGLSVSKLMAIDTPTKDETVLTGSTAPRSRRGSSRRSSGGGRARGSAGA